jgi:hypothetical protein
MKTQDQLYQEFLAKTAPLKAEFDAKIKEATEALEAFRKPYDDQFDADTADIKATITPEVEEVDKKHRYACHKAALPFHRIIKKLEKKRLKKMKPIQAKWDALTAEHQAKLREVLDPKIAEFNALIEKLTNEFNEANKPAHDEYIAAAQELEKQILNTPAGDAA